MRVALALILLASQAVAQAADWPLPEGATPGGDAATDALEVAVGPWNGATVAVLAVDGAASHRAWQIAGNTATPRDLMAPFKRSLADQGFEILYDCAARECGGFDFRFALPVLPEPGMHIDLGDYRYVAARAGGRLVAIWTSRVNGTGFVQISEVEGTAEARDLRGGLPVAPAVTPIPAALPETEQDADPTDLFASGALVLEGVDFAPGARDLRDAKAPVLAQMADWLKADPGRALVLVGHTDGAGALAGNVTVSRQRAEAVRRHLIDDYGVDGARVTAEGAGWLAPRASDATEAGRAANRRVVAIPR